MSGPSAGRPLPVVDDDSRPFWAATSEGVLKVQRCADCGRHVFYPRALCPHCHADGLEWAECSGRGTIYSYAVARRPAGPAFAADVPYVVVLVDLDEGVRMMSNLVTSDVDGVRIGARVRVRFQDVADGVTLPLFELSADDVPAAG